MTAKTDPTSGEGARGISWSSAGPASEPRATSIQGGPNSIPAEAAPVQTAPDDGHARMPDGEQAPILSVRDLWVEYKVRRGSVQAVRGVTFDVFPGETLALIGESGSGKTTLALALIRLLAKTARITRGQVQYRRNGQVINVLSLQPGALRHYRWKECALVFQSALNALNPVLRVWDQLYDVAAAHGAGGRERVRRRATELLRLVQLDPERVLRAFPHELSGGMRQRVLLAMSLLLDPQLIVLDEPTTALDILTQRAIIELLRTLKRELGFAMILVSHDLSLAAELADRIATMYAGEIVEQGTAEEIFYAPHHPYTIGLLKAVPTLTGELQQLESIRGSPPDLIDLPSGCAFHPRCAFGDERCRQQPPPLVALAGAGDVARRTHLALCWHAHEVGESWRTSGATNGATSNATKSIANDDDQKTEAARSEWQTS